MSKYLNLDWNKSQMYEWSQTQQEGSEPAQNGNGFRKYYDKGVVGELQNVGVLEGKFGHQISISVKDGNGDFLNLLFSLYDQKGNVDNQYAESVIRFLPNLQKGQTYRFYPYRIDAETQKNQDQEAGKEVRNKYYDNTGISIKTEDGEKVEAALQYTGKGKNVIPKLVWKENAMGQNRPTAVSVEEKNEFLLTHLKNATEGHLKFEKSNTSEPKQNNSTPKKVPTATPQEAFGDTDKGIGGQDDSELPF